jgi:hypothetical protein
MGSWANNLHVKAESTDAVVAAIRAILGQGGYTVTLDKPRHAYARTATESGGDETIGGAGEGGFPDDDVEDVDDESWREDAELEDDDDFDDEFDAADDEFDEIPDDPASDRRLIITEPHNGWIGILDNDLGGSQDLAIKLSARLHTDVLGVLVNDSDAWYYVFYREGRQTDEFDSSGGSCGDDAGDVSPELAAAMERGDEEEIERLVEKEVWAHAPQGPINMPDGSQLLPPELAALRAQIKSGKSTFWQRMRCRWLWIKFLFKLASGKYRPHGLGMGFDIPRKTPLDPASLEDHLARIKQFFPGMDEAELRRLLPVSRFPAEDLLADFLRFIGLPKLYAYLSYDYLEDYGTGELRADGIRLAHELRFER